MRKFGCPGEVVSKTVFSLLRTLTQEADKLQAHSTPSASRAYASFKQELLLEMGKCLKNNGADFAWKEHVEFTNGREALTNGSAGSDISSELASMAAS